MKFGVDQPKAPSLRRTRTRSTVLQDRMVWQAASLLLGYPDADMRRDLPEMRAIVRSEAAVSATRCAELEALIDALGSGDPLQVEADYVDLFDRGRGTSLHLFEHVHGDSRERGPAMIDLARTYEKAGLLLAPGELPDYLPVVLEFAATVDPVAGRRLLIEHRMPIEVVRDALAERESPYAYAVSAVCATLPAATDQEVRRAQRLAQAGPPVESVGLQPFTLTVPPRRTEGDQ